ncbi:MAG TPA: sigma-70 family RNA polymerase sigma factor [Bacillota bacterium]
MLTPVRSDKEIVAEAALVKRAKSGPEGFVELYNRYFQRLYNYVFYRLRRHQEAEDVVSEVFFKAIGAWLYRIAANAVADHYRRARRTPEPAEPSAEVKDEGPGPAEVAARRLEYDEALTAIGSLPDDQQDALVLRYVQDLDVKEIAVILGRSEGAVRALLSRGLQTTRERLARAGPGPGAAGPRIIGPGPGGERRDGGIAGGGERHG